MDVTDDDLLAALDPPTLTIRPPGQQVIRGPIAPQQPVIRGLFQPVIRGAPRQGQPGLQGVRQPNVQPRFGQQLQGGQAVGGGFGVRPGLGRGQQAAGGLQPGLGRGQQVQQAAAGGPQHGGGGHQVQQAVGGGVRPPSRGHQVPTGGGQPVQGGGQQVQGAAQQVQGVGIQVQGGQHAAGGGQHAAGGHQVPIGGGQQVQGAAQQIQGVGLQFQGGQHAAGGGQHAAGGHQVPIGGGQQVQGAAQQIQGAAQQVQGVGLQFQGGGQQVQDGGQQFQVGALGGIQQIQPAYGAGAQQGYNFLGGGYQQVHVAPATQQVHGAGIQQAGGAYLQQQIPPGPYQGQAGVGHQGQPLLATGAQGYGGYTAQIQDPYYNFFNPHQFGAPQQWYPSQIPQQGIFGQLYGNSVAQQFPSYLNHSEAIQDQLNKSEINSLIKKEGTKLSLLVDAKLEEVKKSDVNFKSQENKERYDKWSSVESKANLIELALKSGADESFITTLLADLKASSNRNQTDEILLDLSTINGHKKIAEFKEYKKLQELGFLKNPDDLKFFKSICKEADKNGPVFGDKHVGQHVPTNQPLFVYPSQQGGIFSDGRQFSQFMHAGQSNGGGPTRPRQSAASGRPNAGGYGRSRKYPPNPATDVVGGNWYCDVCLSSETDHTTWLCPNFRRNDVAINTGGQQQAAAFSRQPLVATTQTSQGNGLQQIPPGPNGP